MSQLKKGLAIQFYEGTYPANGKSGYYYDQIVEWNDLELEDRHDFIQWLFPDNAKAPYLTEEDVYYFWTNNFIRERVIYATLRMMRFYGWKFILVDGKLKLTLIDKKYIYNNRTGLQITHNYLRLTRMMKFLRQIGLFSLSTYVFLMLCRSMRCTPGLLDKVRSMGSLAFWIKTQPYIKHSEPTVYRTLKKQPIVSPYVYYSYENDDSDDEKESENNIVFSSDEEDAEENVNIYDIDDDDDVYYTQTDIFNDNGFKKNERTQFLQQQLLY